MRKKIIFFFVSTFFGLSGFSQNSEPSEKKASFKIDWAGQLTFAKDLKTNVFFTLGGPNLKVGFEKIVLNAGMFPSLKYNYGYDLKIDKTPLSPILGTGIQISYKHCVAGCVFYSIKNIWFAAPAIGYKFK